jgi:hypothetical protein
MSALNKFMSRSFVPPQVHGVLDYPLAAILIRRTILRPSIRNGYRPRITACCAELRARFATAQDRSSIGQLVPGPGDVSPGKRPRPPGPRRFIKFGRQSAASIAAQPRRDVLVTGCRAGENSTGRVADEGDCGDG